MPLVPLFHRPSQPIGRLRVEPAEPGAVPNLPRLNSPDGKRSRRPHADARVAEVRRLIEQTTLTYSQIAARTHVGRASISRWSRDFNWTRPFDAPRATDRMPTRRALQHKKLRTLAERLRQLAERHVAELERAPTIDADKLMAALQLLKMARLQAQGRRRRSKPLWGEAKTGRQMMDEEAAIRTALKEMHRGGVNIDKAPKEAVEMVIDANLPPLGAAFGERGKRR
jgi:transposase